MTIYTIGHSTLTWDEFTHRLRAHNIRHIADVRSMPGSNRYPWFNSEVMRGSLECIGITYSHHPGLGGRRSPKMVTPEVEDAVAGWTHKSFRSYAAWTRTPDFQVAREALEFAVNITNRKIAVLCSEAVPWRCHRSILATTLFPGNEVVHIMSDTQTHKHVPGEWGPAVEWDNRGQPIWPLDLSQH